MYHGFKIFRIVFVNFGNIINICERKTSRVIFEQNLTPLFKNFFHFRTLGFKTINKWFSLVLFILTL